MKNIFGGVFSRDYDATIPETRDPAMELTEEDEQYLGDDTLSEPEPEPEPEPTGPTEITAIDWRETIVESLRDRPWEWKPEIKTYSSLYIENEQLGIKLSYREAQAAYHVTGGYFMSDGSMTKPMSYPAREAYASIQFDGTHIPFTKVGAVTEALEQWLDKYGFAAHLMSTNEKLYRKMTDPPKAEVEEAVEEVLETIADLLEDSISGEENQEESDEKSDNENRSGDRADSDRVPVQQGAGDEGDDSHNDTERDSSSRHDENPEDQDR